MFTKIYNWIREKILWFFVGGTVFAATLLPSEPPSVVVPTYFAEIDRNGIVLRVIVADQAFINSGVVGDPSNWKQTYYQGETRKNYAGIGYKYDAARDAFVPPKPSAEATLDENTARWVLPVVIKATSTASNTATTTP